MANIPISLLPSLNFTSFTSNDLFVVVNGATTYNTPLSGISTYVLSGFTGNTSATCITDLYVTNLYGCSPINVQDSLIMTTGTSISSSNGGGQIDLDAYSYPNTVMISNDNGGYADAVLYLSSGYTELSSYGGVSSDGQVKISTLKSGLQLRDDINLNRFVLYSPHGSFSTKNEDGTGDGFKIMFLNTVLDRFNVEFSGTPIFNITYKPNAFSPTTYSKLLAEGTVSPNVVNSVLLGGTGLTATQSNTTYVDKLNIKTVNTGTSVVNLGIDSNGFVVTGTTTSTLSTKSGTISGTSFTGATLTYDVVFGTLYPSTNYSISITGQDARSFTYELKTVSGFRINTNSSTSLSGDVDWMTIAHGES